MNVVSSALTYFMNYDFKTGMRFFLNVVLVVLHVDQVCLFNLNNFEFHVKKNGKKSAVHSTSLNYVLVVYVQITM